METISASPAATTILIADAQPVFRYGLRQALSLEPEFQVVAEAGDGKAALAHLQQLRPTLAVLEIDLPQLDGLRVAAAAREAHCPSKIVLLSGERQAGLLKRGLRLDVQGYLLKDSTLPEIVAGLRTVAQGMPYFSSAVFAHLLSAGSSAHQALNLAADVPAAYTQLTAAERTILKLLAACCTTKEIAAQLLISPRTVDTHRTNICHKLGLRGNHALTKFALAHREQI
ncbi:MAG: response regulator transcription factor [Blastocatellia bacterium]